MGARWLFFCIFGTSIALTACGGSEPPPRTAASEEPANPRPPKGALWRHEVAAVVDAGFGRFLGFIPTEPVLDGDRFVGFRILDLRPRETWASVDLKVGDVVTHVNGHTVGATGEAQATFQSMRSAKKLEVRFLRNGEPRILEFRIVEQPGIVIPPPPKRGGDGKEAG